MTDDGTNPFSGLKLTDFTPEDAPGPDQRLFAAKQDSLPAPLDQNQEPPTAESMDSRARREKSQTGQPTDQSTGQAVDQSPSPSTGQPSTPPSGRVVDRPKSFYITVRLDRQLDEAVRYFQERHGIRKADRSTIINAVLDDPAQWTESALDTLVDRLISQLTSRLTSRPTG
jgi:hypothetical protein